MQNDAAFWTFVILFVGVPLLVIAGCFSLAWAARRVWGWYGFFCTLVACLCVGFILWHWLLCCYTGGA